MKSNQLVFILLAAAALFAALAALKATRPNVAPNWRAAQTGVVRDAATQQPIAGAYVVARWLEHRAPAFGVGVEQGRCLDRVVVRSGADGRFAIPARADAAGLDPAWAATERREYARDLHVYAGGYSATPSAVSNAASGDADFSLNAEHGAAAERLAQLAATADDFACSGQAKASPVAEALEAEAYAIVCTPARGAEEAEFARLRAALEPNGREPAAHPCAQGHTASVAAP